MEYITYNRLVAQYEQDFGVGPREDNADFTQWLIDRALNARIAAIVLGSSNEFEAEFGDFYEVMGMVLLVLTLYERSLRIQ